MSSVKSRFEGEQEQAMNVQATVNISEEVSSAEGGVYENEPQQFSQWQNEEEEEEGVHESQPIVRDDVIREADKKDITADLPAVGTAKSIRNKFLSGEVESQPRAKREITPPAHGTGGEFVSEPRSVVEQYEGKAEAGVFESEPQVNEDVVNQDTPKEEVLPEKGFAKNVASIFRDMEKNQSTPVSSGKREITPDRSGQAGEYVSEPRSTIEHYEGKAESGVFESEPQYNPDVVRSGEEREEKLPEQGMAKNIASRFKQWEQNENQPQVSARSNRELTPDTSGRVEYVSEPRTQTEEYVAPVVDAGVFENQPTESPDVVKCDSLVSHPEAEDILPERGFAKNVAAKFREMENNVKSPPLSPGRRKEFTPPREDLGKQAGVFESNPEQAEGVVTSDAVVEDVLPQQGSAKNMAQRFREMSASRSPASPRGLKEFTPPPSDSGVFESEPKQFQADYNRPAESGILENEPVMREDVVRETEPPKHEVELPERGFARNLVSQWKQKEAESAQSKSPGSAGQRVKEFTPPRDEPRIRQARTPRTPMSPGGMDNGSVHPSELPGQYQPQSDPSVFESQPEKLDDVYREDPDVDWLEGMPKKDTAKKMLARFQKIQAEAKKEPEAPVSRKESESERSESSEPVRSESSEPEPEPAMENARLKFEDPDKVGRSKSMRAAIQTEKCGACEKTVYAMERLEMNKRVYHKACFRCSQCKAVLTAKTFSVNKDIIFCTTHYKQLFTTKGNYDEGFGHTQHKKRWNSNPNLAAGEGDDSQTQAKS